MSEADALLAAFGRSNGIEGLAFDEAGGCALGFDAAALQLTKLAEAGQVLACAPLGYLPVESAQPLLRELLSANVLFRGTQGATLGADAETGLVTIAYVIPLQGCDEVRFNQSLQNFVQIADRWQRWLDGATQSTPAPESEPPVGMRV